MSNAPNILLIVIAIIAMLFAAALSAGESALIRMTRSNAAQMKAQGRRIGSWVVDRVTSPVSTMQAVTFFRLIAETTMAVCLTIVAFSVIKQWWGALIVAVVVMVLISLLLTRMSPRSLGRSKPEATLVVVGPIMAVCERLVSPFLTRVSAQNGDESDPLEVSTESLRDMVDRAGETDQLEESEREMIHSVIDLGTTITREVMVPRTDMVTTSAGTPLRKARSLFLRSGFSRVPVIGESVDDLLGVLYFKDVVRKMASDESSDNDDVQTIMRPAVFVPDSKPVDDLLREMQADSTHLALVIDEYGGIAGLVTIEDAIEEIVGEVTDEHDSSVREPEELGGGVYRVPARMPVDELGELFGLDIDDDDVDSAGGLLSKALGKVPIPGSEVDVMGLHLIADRVEGRRKQISTILASTSEESET